MIEGRERSVSAPLPPAHLQYGGGGGGGAGAGAEPPLPSSAASGGGTYVLELRVTVGGLPSPRVHEVLAAIEQEAMAAAARAMKRLLLAQLHETRTLDARLAAGGVYEVPKVLTRHIALHERLRPDKEKALTAACAALQPLAIQEEPLLFVYRSPSAASEGSQRGVFLLQLALVEREPPPPPPTTTTERRRRMTSRRNSPAPASPSSGATADGAGGLKRSSSISALTAAHADSGGGGGSGGEACVELTVRGVDPPAEELSGGLLNHLREKLEELTLALFAQLLPRIAHTRLSEADLSFLRPPDAPPLAVATVPLPAAIGGRGVADADAEGVCGVRGCRDARAGCARAGGAHSTTRRVPMIVRSSRYCTCRARTAARARWRRSSCSASTSPSNGWKAAAAASATRSSPVWCALTARVAARSASAGGACGSPLGGGRATASAAAAVGWVRPRTKAGGAAAWRVAPTRPHRPSDGTRPRRRSRAFTSRASARRSRRGSARLTSSRRSMQRRRRRRRRRCRRRGARSGRTRRRCAR